jgi:hypothetical protein
MKKTTTPKSPAKKKTRVEKRAPGKKRKDQVDLALDLFKNLDLLKMLSPSGQELLAAEDPVDLFSEYLEVCSQRTVDEDERSELVVDLIEALSELQVDSNGGDPDAREKNQAIYDLLDDAIEDRLLQAPDLMMTGKILSDAGWVIPDSLKQATVEALQASPPEMEESGTPADLVASLLEIADKVGQNPFDVYEHLNSVLACFPPEGAAMLLLELIAANNAVINQAVAGFLLHPDAALAQSVAEAFAVSASKNPVQSSLVERLVRMRPWLPQDRQAHIDAAIKAMRLNALPPEKTEVPKIIKCYASVCDGSGTRNLIVTQRIGGHYQIATVMMKPAGVADAMVIPELPKSEMDGMVRQLKSSVLKTETDIAGISRDLALALADNLAQGNPPPFKLVEVMESLGIGPLPPDHSSSIEIINGLLAELPPEQTNPEAVAKAHADILDSEFAYQWFEAGEAVEDLLYPAKGSKQRVAKLMKVYLPDRRAFWARQCAISAFVMHGDKISHESWKQLALVGRDIASDVPLDQIPLMKKIAELSVQAFEQRL